MLGQRKLRSIPELQTRMRVSAALFWRWMRIYPGMRVQPLWKLGRLYRTVRARFFLSMYPRLHRRDLQRYNRFLWIFALHEQRKMQLQHKRWFEMWMCTPVYRSILSVHGGFTKILALWLKLPVVGVNIVVLGNFRIKKVILGSKMVISGHFWVKNGISSHFGHYSTIPMTF